MKIKLWPERNWQSLLRLAVLLSLLTVATFFSIALQQFRRTSAAAIEAGGTLLSARLFEDSTHQQRTVDPNEIELHALYGRSLLAQTGILSTCAETWEKTRAVPSTPEDLSRAGIEPATQVDPWGRSYRIRQLPGDVLIVQSTGPSGQDRVPWESPSELETMLQGGPKMFGDNLVVALKLSQRGGREPDRH
jgi:hypothetical protein